MDILISKMCLQIFYMPHIVVIFFSHGYKEKPERNGLSGENICCGSKIQSIQLMVGRAQRNSSSLHGRNKPSIKDTPKLQPNL